MIEEKETGWGSLFLDTLSHDLKLEFPEMNGLSVRNLKYTRQYYLFHSPQIRQQPVAEFNQHPVAQIPWGMIY